MTGPSVTVHRIDADPVDVPDGPTLARLREHRPATDATQWRQIVDFLPSARLRTHVGINEKGWPSSSDLLAEIGECGATTALLDLLPDDGWLDHEWQWADAERADQARADPGDPTILLWRRPLVRLGALITVQGERALPRDMSARLESAFGAVLPLERGPASITFVARGMPQDVEARIGIMLTPE